MELQRRLAHQLVEPALHRRVDILVALAGLEAAVEELAPHQLEPLHQRLTLLLADQAGGLDRLGPGYAAGDVGLGQPPVEAKRVLIAAHLVAVRR